MTAIDWNFSVEATAASLRRYSPIRSKLLEATAYRGRAARLEAVEVSAWFGGTQVLDDVSLLMRPATVTALIGPSGCGKSTFLRILNRMHESVSGAQLAGEVHLNGEDIYSPGRRVTETRRRIGMVFQKPNPFPAMSIADNVVAGLTFTGKKKQRGAA